MSWIDTIVISPSTGTVPEWLDTTSAPPSAGMFSAPRTSTRNHFSRERADRGEQEPLGDLGVEAVLVDLEVAGHPAAQERQELGEPLLPAVAEDLRGGRGQRLQPVADRDAAGRARGPGRLGAVAGASAAGSVGGRRRRRARRAGSSAGSARRRRRRRSSGGVGGLGRRSRRRPSCGAAAGPARRAGRRRRLAAAGAAAGLAAGAQRDDLGVSHGRLRRSRRERGQARRAARQQARARASAPKSANASAVVYVGLEPEHGAHPGGVEAAAEGQEAGQLGLESA